MRPDLPSGTVTFLFTDVEGSTRLLHALGAEAYADALVEHRHIIREACVAEGGVEVDTQGDAFFFVFPSAPGALAAASGFTDALSSTQIRVRVGLHTGTPLLAEEGYVGDDVHFAARVGSSAHGGQVVLSSATAKLVDAELSDLGEHRLKDIEQAVPLFQLGDGSFPPLKTISNTNLPRPASSFLGREHELAEVLGRIEAGARLLTLTGPGGTGKTRLALEAASSLVPSYKAGVFWVGLASLRDPALVTETISQTLGAKDGLAEHISERELLLLLDNFEQVIEAAPELSALLAVCPNLTLLVTSRELLRVQGEVEYPVPPLAEPEAVALFCERVQTEPTDEIAELCVRLDSLPLAVELAAARTKALSPAQILERLSQRLDLLKGGRDADPRQQTLRATIEWSYELLSPDEQQLFARLSVFAGGCTLEAAEEVADADLDTLQSLVEKSLLRFTNDRYWMLETIREYATERLVSAGESEDFRDLHARWVITAADRQSPSEQVPPTAWLGRLDEEQSNIRAALAWLDCRGDVERFGHLAGLVWPWWFIRGQMTEGRLWLEKTAGNAISFAPTRWEVLTGASELALRQGEYDRALVSAVAALRAARNAGDDRLVAFALRVVGNCCLMTGKPDRAQALYEESARCARAIGDRTGVARAVANLGSLALERGEWESARDYSEEAYALAREAGNVQGLIATRFNKGFAYLEEGRVDEARPLFVEALLPAIERRWKEGVVFPVEALAAIAVARGDAVRAARLLGACAALREQTGLAEHGPESGRLMKTREAARGTLGIDGFKKAFEAGRRLALDEACAEALLVR